MPTSATSRRRDRHGPVVVPDPALQLREQRLDELGMRGHGRLEPGILGRQMPEDRRILDLRIAGVTQPVIRILDPLPVCLVGEGPLLGARGVGTVGHGVPA